MSTKKTQGGHRISLLKGASVLAAAAAAMAGAPAAAQDEGEAIVVTGSRIPQPNLVTTSPVTQVTGEDIRTQGVTRVEDLTNELPQVFAGQDSTVSNGATGIATVDLRGLGPGRTLVLIDGRRMGFGSPNQAAPDLNQIPGPMVERVEVLTGGASAVYGSDAVAGVVNFIMNDSFEGLRLDAQYGFYQHNNDSDDHYIREVIAGRALTNPSQYHVPDDNQDDGFGREITAVFGASLPDDRGHVSAYAGYRNNDAILQAYRDFSACAIGGSSTAAVPGVPAGAVHWTCGGSGTTFPGQFATSAGTFTVDYGAPNNFVPYDSNLNAYNFGPINYFQRPDERYTFGAFANYQVNDSIEAYAQMMFMDYRSLSQIAPSGDFFNTTTINCGNPFLPANTVSLGICTTTDVSNNNSVPFYVARRNVEGGGRQDDLNYTSYRLVGGIRGPLTDTWDYDIAGSFSRTAMQRTYLNDFSVQRLTNALNVTNAGPNGILGDGDDAPICASVLDGTDTACVPWDIFNPGGVSQAALDYLQIPLVQRGENLQQDVVASVTGEFPWGSPMAESNIAASFGVEYRRDELNAISDTNFETGNAAGQGGPTQSLSGVTDVFDVFAEARVPLVEGAAFADLLSMDFAYRYSDYGSGTTTDTYKIGAEWAPSQDLRFRGSFQRAVRAPNVIELFSSQGFGLFNLTADPCHDDGAGPLPPPPAICFAGNSGGADAMVTVPQSLAGSTFNLAGQYNQLTGGNPDLDPEEADTITLGFVFQPSFIEGLTISIDYFNIDLTSAVSTLSPSAVVTNCYATNNPTTCALIHRNPANGSLYIGNGFVQATNVNIGGVETTGYDINANYRFDIGSMGAMSLNLIGTYLDELIVDLGAPTGVAPFDCAGLYSAATACGSPNPEWRHRFRVSWETPWDINADLTWRYYGEVTRDTGNGVPATSGPDQIFEAENYFDLAGTWQIMENTRLRFGVNNVLDNDPPLTLNTRSNNGNTFPGTYDALGRWIFMGATVDF